MCVQELIKRLMHYCCQELDSIWEREYLLFARASNFAEIDRSYFPPIFNNAVPTIWLIINGG